MKEISSDGQNGRRRPSCLPYLPRDLPGKGIFLTPAKGPLPLAFGPRPGFGAGACGPLGRFASPASAGGRWVIFGMTLPFARWRFRPRSNRRNAHDKRAQTRRPAWSIFRVLPCKVIVRPALSRSFSAALRPSSQSCPLSAHSSCIVRILPNPPLCVNADAPISPLGSPRCTPTAPLVLAAVIFYLLRHPPPPPRDNPRPPPYRGRKIPPCAHEAAHDHPRFRP